MSKSKSKNEYSESKKSVRQEYFLGQPAELKILRVALIRCDIAPRKVDQKMPFDTESNFSNTLKTSISLKIFKTFF